MKSAWRRKDGAVQFIAPIRKEAASHAVRASFLRFWGARGSIPAPGTGTVRYGGNTSCVEVRADGELIILDAGSGIRPLGHALVSEFKLRALHLTILLTHTHWDHIQGFPFFLPAYDRRNRIRVLGFGGAPVGLTRILSLQMQGPYFPIGLEEMPGHILIEEMNDLEFKLGRVKIRAAFMNHPGACVGYRLFTSRGSITYIPDNEPCYLLHPQAAKQLSGKAELKSPARAFEQRLVHFIRGSDVLILDAQYDMREYRSHVGWGHGCLEEVVALALRGNVKRLYLFHHDPEHADEKISAMVKHARQMARAQGSRLVIEAAREGKKFELPAMPAQR